MAKRSDNQKARSPRDRAGQAVGQAAIQPAGSDAAAEGLTLDQALRTLDQLRFRVEQLEAEVAKAQRLSLLGTMVGVIAHEFNNILTPVLSYCQLAKARPADLAMTAKALDRAAGGAERAARISNAILELTREEQLGGAAARSGLASQGGQCDLRRVIDDVLLSMARDPAKDGIAVTIDGNGSPLVRIPPIALHHVLLNLVINARKAMTGGGRLAFRYTGPGTDPNIASGGDSTTARADRVPCSTWNTPEGPDSDHEPRADGWVTLEVEDTGCGIPDGVLGRLFEPFATQSHDTAPAYPGAENSRGTGLGLTISKRLVEEAGGSIAASSQRGAGTRFILRLRAA